MVLRTRWRSHYCISYNKSQRETRAFADFFENGGNRMRICGVICEYNPFHRGHEKQLRQIRAALGEDTAVVCLMSGNFVQRGEPAVFDKRVRAQAAVLAGANLVLELPITKALSSAEGFVRGGAWRFSRSSAAPIRWLLGARAEAEMRFWRRQRSCASRRMTRRCGKF